MELTGKAVIAAGAVALVAGFLLEQKAKAAIEAAANDVNPVNPQNIFYRSTDAVGAAVSGNKSFDLGRSLYCFFHASEAICNPTPANAGASVSGLLGLSGLSGVPPCR